jgi:hypothetical protein
MLLSNLTTFNSNSILTQMTVATVPADVMIGMLRKGNTGTEILDILNVIVSDQTERSENDDENGAYSAEV